MYRRDSDGLWVASLSWTTDNGRRRRPVRYAKTEAAAWRALRDLQRLREDRKPLTATRTRLDAWIEHWTTSTLAAADIAESTRATYATLARKHVAGRIGGLRLVDVTPSRVEQLLLGLERDGLAASTRRQVHTVLGLILSAAVRDGLLVSNPAASVDRPRVPRREAQWWTSEQVASLRAAAAGHRLAGLLDVVVFTGLRRGEALGLRWTDVDLDAGLLRVTGTLTRGANGLARTQPKTAAGVRVLPLLGDSARALRARRSEQRAERLAAGEMWTDTGYVFTTEIGTPVDPRNAFRWLAGAVDRAGVPSGSWHTLRHSAASVLLAAGVPPIAVSRALGHSSIDVTNDLYGHLSGDGLAALLADGYSGYAGA